MLILNNKDLTAILARLSNTTLYFTQKIEIHEYANLYIMMLFSLKIKKLYVYSIVVHGLLRRHLARNMLISRHIPHV